MPQSAGHPRRVVQAVFLNQLIWTAGYSLTSGGFLLFFARELGAKGLAISIVLTLPEIASFLGVCSRTVVSLFATRKRMWLVCTIAARFGSVIIPIAALITDDQNLLWLMIIALIVTYTLQSFAYTAYLSWVADMAPANRWGRLFSTREIAKVAILLILPTSMGFLRDSWKESEWIVQFYATTFLLGTLLQLASIPPLMSLPTLDVNPLQPLRPSWSVLADIFRDTDLRWLIIHRWWLAFFQGITQAPIFLYSVRELGVGLGPYTLLTVTMYGIQLLILSQIGRVSDQIGNKWPSILGLLGASAAMLFWMAARPESWWWIIGAYICWGCFAIPNVCERNLLLKLSPRTDNQLHIAMFRHSAGLLAGLSGLLGGILLDDFLGNRIVFAWLGLETNSAGPTFEAKYPVYLWFFTFSFLGRITAPLFLIPIREPKLAPK